MELFGKKRGFLEEGKTNYGCVLCEDMDQLVSEAIVPLEKVKARESGTSGTAMDSSEKQKVSGPAPSLSSSDKRNVSTSSQLLKSGLERERRIQVVRAAADKYLWPGYVDNFMDRLTTGEDSSALERLSKMIDRHNSLENDTSSRDRFDARWVRISELEKRFPLVNYHRYWWFYNHLKAAWDSREPPRGSCQWLIGKANGVRS